MARFDALTATLVLALAAFLCITVSTDSTDGRIDSLQYRNAMCVEQKSQWRNRALPRGTVYQLRSDMSFKFGNAFADRGRSNAAPRGSQREAARFDDGHEGAQVRQIVEGRTCRTGIHAPERHDRWRIYPTVVNAFSHGDYPFQEAIRGFSITSVSSRDAVTTVTWRLHICYLAAL